VSERVPRHYSAFRLLLVGLVLGLLGVAVFHLVQPGNLEEILRWLRVQR
jgi:hypothetical protein